MPNGTGKQTRTVNEGEEPEEWGDCILASCDDGYTKGGGACHETTVNCIPLEAAAVHSTAGTKTYPEGASGYGDCIPNANSCVSNYTYGSDGACYRKQQGLYL